MRGVRWTAREVPQLGQLLFAKMTDTESACCYRRERPLTDRCMHRSTVL